MEVSTPDLHRFPEAVMSVRWLATADGSVMVGGDFPSMNGVSRRNLARLNNDGSVDTGFSIQSDFVVNVFKMQPDGKLLVGRHFNPIVGPPPGLCFV